MRGNLGGRLPLHGSGVYPRVCGGTRGIGDYSAWLRGLSPRVRGNPPIKRKGLSRTGLSPRVRGNRLGHSKSASTGSIPACAGEPPLSPSASSATWVYPRVCGGTLLSPPHCGSAIWVYPRVCGGTLPKCPLRIADLDRVYPRVCGGTRAEGPGRCSGWVYPRVCGGTGRYPTGLLVDGVYPRVCGGTARADRTRIVREGSIPACAGEPPSGRPLGLRIRVYPRVCGGTGRELTRRGADRVYPRVCGGTPRPTASATGPTGLSPRVRGNHCRARHSGWPNGSIPACAGEPRSRARRGTRGRVYPRVCGGTA